MRYRLGFSSNKDSSSVYIECSIRKPGVKHPVREIIKRFGKKKDLLAKDPAALQKIQEEVDRMNLNCEGRKLLSTPTSLELLSKDLSELLQRQTLILVPFFVLVVPAILSCAASMMNLNWMLSSITLQRKALSSMT